MAGRVIDLCGKVVLVTGGSVGIGFACAQELLGANASVVLAARGTDALATAAQQLAAEYDAHRVAACPADVGVFEQVDRLVAFALDRFGRLDGVVHAAAVLGPIGTILDVDPGSWADTIRANLVGTFAVARSAAAAMRSHGGRMVFFSGGGASGPFPNYSAYAASKVAVVRFVETIACELAPYDIAVNALAPGFVATRMHDATLAAGDRAGSEYHARTKNELAGGGVSPNVAARAATFLLSGAAHGITGRFVAAPYDDYERWPERFASGASDDFFTLRRIVPRDRGEDWQ